MFRSLSSWSTRARSSSTLPSLLPFVGWCLLDWLGVAWEPPTSWCGVEPRSLYGQGDRLLHEDLPIVRLVLHGRNPWWNRRGCNFVDPNGWSPMWTLATATLRGLKSPSAWTYDSTTYWNHGKNLRVSKLCLILLPTLYFIWLSLLSADILLDMHV